MCCFRHAQARLNPTSSNIIISRRVAVVYSALFFFAARNKIIEEERRERESGIKEIMSAFATRQAAKEARKFFNIKLSNLLLIYLLLLLLLFLLQRNDEGELIFLYNNI